MPQISSSTGIALEFETHGNPGDPPVLLVMGFGTQLINWPRGFAQAIADGGRRVITFDNRDCGLSQRFDGVPANIHAILGAAGAGDFDGARRGLRRICSATCPTSPRTADRARDRRAQWSVRQWAG